MLTKEEFVRLQKLAAISLDENQTEKLWNQLWTIVDFLGKLQHISLQWKNTSLYSSFLQPLSWVTLYKDAESLFDNVTHEKVANSIVIASVIDN